MEKYPIFSGLNSLCCQNLATNKILLPKHGTVGRILRSGEIVNFDLDSKDIWLDIQVECKDIKLVIFFEARVAKNLQIETLMKYLIEIINQILLVNKIDLRYDFEQLSIQKMHLFDGNIVAKNLKSSVLGQGNLPQYLREIENDKLVYDIFDYLDRCLLAELEKSNQNVKKMNLSVINEAEAKKLDPMSFELPIRGLRVEEKKIILNESKPKHRKGTVNRDMNPTVCSCGIF